MKPITSMLVMILVIMLLTVSASVEGNNNNNDHNYGGVGGPFGAGSGGGGFSIPGFGKGFGNNIIGGGMIRPTVVCKDRGPCFQKKLTCPPRCFSYAAGSGKGYAGGGGGGGCIIDCKTNCTAYC